MQSFVFDFEAYRSSKHDRDVLRLCAMLYITNQVVVMRLLVSLFCGLCLVFIWLLYSVSQNPPPPEDLWQYF